MGLKPTFEDITGCESVLFEWAESYDSKDWERLKQCIAPSLRIDYREFINKLWEDMPAAEFVEMASHPHFLGNPRLKTQHFVGVTRWEKINETLILGHHQMRVAHQKHGDDELKEIVAKGHTHGSGTMTYRKVDGVWKFAGIEPHLRWVEFGGEGIFAVHEEKEEEEEEEGEKFQPEKNAVNGLNGLEASDGFNGTNGVEKVEIANGVNGCNRVSHLEEVKGAPEVAGSA